MQYAKNRLEQRAREIEAHVGVPLHEYNKLEWFDVARALKPGLTETEYDRMWTAFVSAKRARTLS
jgi:hypothetical protein